MEEKDKPVAPVDEEEEASDEADSPEISPLDRAEASNKKKEEGR